jgi:hypothetical protein
MRRMWFWCAIASTLTLLALGPASAGAAVSDGQIEAATGQATAWFRAQQLPGGALGANGGLDPAWAFLGLAGAGVNAADLRTEAGAPSAQDYYLGLWTGPSDLPWASIGQLQASDYERVIMLANAAGLDPLRLSAEQNLLAKLAGFDHGGYFGLKGTFNQTMFAAIALDQLPVPEWLTEQVAENIEANVHEDGGWTYSAVESQAGRERPGEIDLTGAALAGLCGAGRTAQSPAVTRGIAFLEGMRSPGGAIGNVDSTSWALDGLGACGVVRGSAEWTAGDEETIEWLLSQQLGEGAWPSAGKANYYATQDALRALADPGFFAEPPARLEAGQPARRPPVTVAPGTPVPTVLAIDAGFGSIQLCSTTAPAGATLTEALGAARAESSPANCVGEFKTAAGEVTSINGAVARPGSGGGWKFSLDGGAEEAAAEQTVGFGRVVGLRLDQPSALISSLSSLEFEPTPVGEAAPTLEVTFTNHTEAAMTLGAPTISGAAAADFSILGQDCSAAPLATGASCAVTVGFSPVAGGERAASIEIPVEGREAVTVALGGEGIAPPPVEPEKEKQPETPPALTPPGESPPADSSSSPGASASAPAPAPSVAQPPASAPVLVGITRLNAAGLRLSVNAPGTLAIKITRAVGSGRHRHWQGVKTLSVKAAAAGQVTAKFPRLPPGRYRVTVVLPDGNTLNRNLTITTGKTRHA